MRQEFAHAMSGKPEAVQKTSFKPIHGYIIRDMLGSLYVTNTTVHINKWREIEHESDLFWVITEKTSPILHTRFILYKNKDIADEHLKELKDA